MSIRKRTCLALGLVALLAAVAAPGTSHAVPLLQLDISPGTSIDGTTISGGSSFTLYGLVNKRHPNFVAGETYYISAAVIPNPGESDPPPSLGAITIGPDTINVTADMTFGAPPIASLAPDDLAGHNVFDTYYTELSFVEADTFLASEYNVQDDPGDPVANVAGTLLAFAISVDVGDLATGFQIHFDMYTRDAAGNLGYFAPFSHDAESLIPEPASMVVWGLLASLGLCLGCRRRRRAA